jgi:hypothetical protein
MLGVFVHAQVPFATGLDVASLKAGLQAHESKLKADRGY